MTTTPDPAASAGAASPGTVEAARLIGLFLGFSEGVSVPSGFTDAAELIIQRHAVERVLTEMYDLSAEWERQIELVLDRAEKAEARLTTAEAERDEALALWKNEVQFREEWKTRAEKAEAAGLSLLEFVDSPELNAEVSWAAAHGYSCDAAVSRRNADTIKSARAALEASKPPEEKR